MNRYSLRVPAADAEIALARMLELFPEGVEEERDGGDVVLAGYAEEPPAPDLEPQAVEPAGRTPGGRSTGPSAWGRSGSGRRGFRPRRWRS